MFDIATNILHIFSNYLAGWGVATFLHRILKGTQPSGDNILSKIVY